MESKIETWNTRKLLRQLEWILALVSALCAITIPVIDVFGDVTGAFSIANSAVINVILFVTGSVTAYIVFERKLYFREVLTQIRDETAGFNSKLEREVQASHSKLENEVQAANDNLKTDLLSSFDDLRHAVLGSYEVQNLGVRGHGRANNIYDASFNSATERINIIALTGEYFTNRYREQIIRKIKEHYCVIQILILNPASDLWPFRYRDEDGNFSSREVQIKAIETVQDRVRKTYLEFNDLIDDKDCRGSLTVRYYDRIPYVAMYQADSTLIMGLYNSCDFGVRSHAIQVAMGSTLSLELQSHFNAVWDCEFTQTLIRIGGGVAHP